MGDTGPELVGQTPGEMAILSASGAESGALCAELALSDPELAEVIRCWADLPNAVRANVLAMVRAATDHSRFNGEKTDGC